MSSPKSKSKPKTHELDTYTHDESTPSIPRAGLAEHETQPDTFHTYAFDPNESPQLDWAGKEEADEFTVTTTSIHRHETVIPQRIIFQVQKEELRKPEQQVYFFPEASYSQRLNDRMRAIETYSHSESWKNRMIAGDSLIIMNSLIQKENMQGRVQMAYIDPPYGIKYGSNFQPFVNKRDVKDRNDEDLTSEPEMIRAFRDTWELGIHSYLSYLRNRLLLVRELLSDSGSVFVQISDENVHLVRCICDEIFGRENFVSEIAFRKKSMSLGAMYLESSHDYIVWYAKDKKSLKYHQLYKFKNIEGDAIWNMIELSDGRRRKLTREEINDHSLIQGNGKIFRLHDLYPAGFNDNAVFGVKYNGKIFYPPKGKSWKTSEQGMQRLIESKRVIEVGGRLHHVLYLDDYNVSPIMDMWADTSAPPEKLYVVQTSTKVIQRCILMTTDPGDLVLDITCGSGTTAYVAEQWGRRWITCDTSRVAIAIARQRLLTAQFDYYRLADPSKGINAGFVYKTVPHVTLKSIANNEPPATEILYDAPEIDSKKTRVTGPFTIEALPAPVVFSVDEAINSDADSDEGAKLSDWREQLQATGIITRKGERIRFSRIESLSGTHWLNAKAYTDEEDSKFALVCFAGESTLLDSKRVALAIDEASKQIPKPDFMIFAAFQTDPEAQELLNSYNWEGVAILQVQMNPDLMTEDLKRKVKTDQSFWLVGQPDVELTHISENQYRVSVQGFDYYDVNSGRIDSGNTDRIAMWMLDSDYDGMTMNPSQVFFPMEGKSGGWKKLSDSLKAEIDETLIEAYRGNISLPFESSDGKKIAVKIIDDRGIESMKVITVMEGE